MASNQTSPYSALYPSVIATTPIKWAEKLAEARQREADAVLGAHASHIGTRIRPSVTVRCSGRHKYRAAT